MVNIDYDDVENLMKNYHEAKSPRILIPVNRMQNGIFMIYIGVFLNSLILYFFPSYFSAPSIHFFFSVFVLVLSFNFSFLLITYVMYLRFVSATFLVSFYSLLVSL